MLLDVDTLYPSVMTSSSMRRFGELFAEVRRISDVNHFDIFVIRDADMGDPENGGIGLSVPDRGKLSDVLADPDNFNRIHDWLLTETEAPAIKIPALATYIPDITSKHEDLRETAITALVNCMKFAIALATAAPRRMSAAVVEMVCGTVLECNGAPPEVEVFGAEFKIELLCRSLDEAIQRLGDVSVPFGFALEVEPGETYVLNNARRMASIARRLEASPALSKHVGFNLDIAHMRIERLSANQLAVIAPRLVHAHISDHPWIHTHDQTVGSWTNVERVDDGFQPYLKCLLQRSAHYREAVEVDKDALPFTNSIGIELEGCNRIFAIHDSISRLKHAIAIATSQ